MTETEIEARLREMLAESGIEDEGSDELVGCLRELERYVDETPPEPSPQLAAVMAGLARNVVTAPFGRRRTRLFIAGAAAFGTVAAGGIAAAAEVLPPAAQTIVAEFSEKYLPFELPHPDGQRQPRQSTPDDPVVTTDREDSGNEYDAPVATPESNQTTAQEPTTEPSVAPTPSAEATPTAQPTEGTEPTVSPTDPSVAPDPSDVPTDEVTDPEAGGSPSTDPSAEPSDPSAEPSPSSSPTPTANTRTESGDDPSSTPSSSPSGSSSPSASASSTVWTDAG